MLFRSIALNAKDAESYINRGVLKYQKLNNPQGAISDFRTAVKIYRKQGQASDLQDAIDRLRALGASE